MVYLEHNSNRMAQSHQDLINFLQQNGFNANCTTCGDSFMLKDAKLFSVDNFNTDAKRLLNEKKEELKERKEIISKKKSSTQKRVETTTGSVNMGFILERLAPVLAQFPFDKNDCRCLFDPIDQQSLLVTTPYPEMVAEMYPHFENEHLSDFGKNN